MPFLKQLFATLVVLSVSLHTEAFTTRMCHHQGPYYPVLFLIELDTVRHMG